MKHKVLTALLVTAAAIGSSGLFGAIASATSDIGGTPARPRDGNERSKSIFLHEIKPGQSKTDTVKVFNNSDKRQEVQVYAVDAQISSGGAFACKQKAEDVKEAGKWIKLERERVSLAPYTTQEVDFTIRVPEGVDVGEHNACIAIQGLGEESVSSQGGINLSFRSAIRVAVTVPGEIS